MIPPHNIYQIYQSLSVRDDCTPPKCGELSEYTDSAHTEVEDPSLGCIETNKVTKEGYIIRQDNAGVAGDGYVLRGS